MSMETDPEMLEMLERRPEAESATRVRGHIAYMHDEMWFYDDNGRRVDSELRHCTLCGRKPVWCEYCNDDHDACLGHVPGKMDACCGHGHSEYKYALTRYDLAT